MNRKLVIGIWVGVGLVCCGIPTVILWMVTEINRLAPIWMRAEVDQLTKLVKAAHPKDPTLKRFFPGEKSFVEWEKLSRKCGKLNDLEFKEISMAHAGKNGREYSNAIARGTISLTCQGQIKTFPIFAARIARTWELTTRKIKFSTERGSRGNIQFVNGVK